MAVRRRTTPLPHPSAKGLYYSIVMVEVMVSIYRRQLWLLAQGLLQLVLSLQVSVAMPYYSIVMVSIGVSSGS